MKDEFLKNSVKSTQLNLNVDRVGSIKLPLPDLDEQLKIVGLLNCSTILHILFGDRSADSKSD